MSDSQTRQPPVLIAMLVENTEWSWPGAFAAFGMVIVTLLAAAGIFLFPTNAIQQATSALGALLLIIPLGVGAIIGRKRTYKVFREVHPETPR